MQTLVYAAQVGDPAWGYALKVGAMKGIAAVIAVVVAIVLFKTIAYLSR